MTMRPLSRVSKPAIIRSKVVLPHPEGPSSAKKAPGPTPNETSSTAVIGPKRFEAPAISSSAIPANAQSSFLRTRRAVRDIRDKSPSPPFRGEREGPVAQRWEGEVGGGANRHAGPPHPALSPPRPAGGERVKLSPALLDG